MSLYLRQANISDAEQILEWRNDPVTRANSFNGDPIDLETHLKWFERKLSDDRCRMYVLTDGNKDLGFIRLDIEDASAEISYMIAPAFRGHGYGREIIRLITLNTPGQIETLKAYTKEDNPVSGRCFISNGFTRSIEDGKVCYTKKCRT